MIILLIFIISAICYKLSNDRLSSETVLPASFESQNTVIESPKTYIDPRGYRRFTNSHRLVSRWVVSKSLNHPLLPAEVVHHIDGNKLNDSAKNLHPFPNQAAHEKHHREILAQSGFWYEKVPSYIINRYSRHTA